MFGFLSGTERADANTATLIHRYLETYQRTHSAMGFDSLVSAIRGDPLVSGFLDLDAREYHDYVDYKQFRITRDLPDFLFLISKPPNEDPMIAATGTDVFKGVTFHLDCSKSSYKVSLRRGAVPRAIKLAKVYQSKFGASLI